MIEKKYSPKGKSCKVTFALPADIGSENVAVVGEFNDWNAAANPLDLKKRKKQWMATLALKPGQSYRFRYLVDGEHWHNDEAADSYEPNAFFTDNCVVNI